MEGLARSHQSKYTLHLRFSPSIIYAPKLTRLNSDERVLLGSFDSQSHPTRYPSCLKHLKSKLSQFLIRPQQVHHCTGLSREQLTIESAMLSSRPILPIIALLVSMAAIQIYQIDAKPLPRPRKCPPDSALRNGKCVQCWRNVGEQWICPP